MTFFDFIFVFLPLLFIFLRYIANLCLSDVKTNNYENGFLKNRILFLL